MARWEARPRADRERVLHPLRACCPGCGRRMGIRDDNRRPVATLRGLVRLRLKIRRGEDVACARHRRPYRPEGEGAIVLPRHEFGLEVMALVGALRYREHQSVPEIHRVLLERGVAVGERTVTNLLDRYDELVATVLDEPQRVALVAQQRVILAIDGLQPDVGHEVLWVFRDGLSGQGRLARSLLSGHRQRPRRAVGRGRWRDGRAGSRHRERWAAFDPAGGAAGPAGRAAPAGPLPLSACGGAADLRG